MKLTHTKIYNFLLAADRLFSVPLSQKQDLYLYAQKLQQYATICAVEQEETVRAMVAGYTNQDLAYIAIAATLPQAQRKGYGKLLIQEFLGKARDAGCTAVHLYAVPDNLPAMKLYRDLGFVPMQMADEPRPEDAHLIYYL